jgi:hypothetical protein
MREAQFGFRLKPFFSPRQKLSSSKFAKLFLPSLLRLPFSRSMIYSLLVVYVSIVGARKKALMSPRGAFVEVSAQSCSLGALQLFCLRSDGAKHCSSDARIKQFTVLCGVKVCMVLRQPAERVWSAIGALILARVRAFTSRVLN